jgi:hypothetical protein
VRRFVALILFPALVLVGLFLLGRAAANWHYVYTANPGEVMFVSAFDGLLDDWQTYDDGQLAAQTPEGVLRLSVDAPQRSPFSAATPYFGDFDLRVTATAVEGPLNNGYGVIFRMKDPNNYYQFLTSSDGYYQVERAVNGSVRVLSIWIPSEIVNQGLGEANTLRVVARGNQFQFFVNNEPALLCIPDDPNALSTYDDLAEECIGGQMLDTLTDSSHATGRVGLVAQSFDEAGVVVDFDNLVVSAPTAE